MCIKCSQNGQQITIVRSTIAKLGALKKDLNFNCMSDLLEHMIVVLNNDRQNAKPTLPQDNTQELEVHIVRSKKGVAPHLMTDEELVKVGNTGNGTTLCGKPAKATWSRIEGAAAADICTGCRAAIATMPAIKAI